MYKLSKDTVFSLILHVVNALVKYLLLSSACFFAALHLSAQETVGAELDRYESACEMCLNLKTRLAAGESVSKDEAKVTIDLFLAINRGLKEQEEQMTAFERRRFESIGEWFSTGVKPALPVLLPAVVGPCLDLQCVTQYQSVLVSMSLPDEPVVPQKETEPDLLTYVLFEVDPFSMSYGARTVLTFGRFGGFVSYRSNFDGRVYEYECASSGAIPGGGMFWPSGNDCLCARMYTAGIAFECLPWLAVYAGGGYGERSLMWQDIDAGWAKVADWSQEGVAVDAGILVSWRMFAISAGASSIAFRTFATTVGLGLRF